MENRYNLVDEAWIPVADHGRVSLRDVFSNPTYRRLGGNPVEKIALLKLLLAIAQAACTPQTDDEWRSLGSDRVAARCLEYLEDWRDRFYLYGDAPFLQIPAAVSAKVQPFGAVRPEVATGNTTVLSQIQIERPITSPDQALLLLTLMGFALSGKKTDNSLVLTEGYAGKLNERGRPSTGRPGPSVGHMGFLHSFLLGEQIQQSVWLNLLTYRQIHEMKIYPEGVGVPPWEQMPIGEDCQIAQTLRRSLMGRLLPMCRFCLLTEDGLHYSEGLAHPGYKEGVVDPSMAVNNAGNEPKALWANPEKRPWRELTALLSFLGQGESQGFQSLQLHSGIDRARDVLRSFAIWSGGLRVSSNAGEQYASGRDDFVESEFWLQCGVLGESWFQLLKFEMDAMDTLARNLYGRVTNFYREQNVDSAKAGRLAEQVTHLFWQLCEREFQALVDCCHQTDADASRRHRLRVRLAAHAHRAFDQLCPRDTARQLDAWAKFRPNTSRYLKQEA